MVSWYPRGMGEINERRRKKEKEGKEVDERKKRGYIYTRTHTHTHKKRRRRKKYEIKRKEPPYRENLGDEYAKDPGGRFSLITLLTN